MLVPFPMLWQPNLSPDVTKCPLCWQKLFWVENHCPIASLHSNMSQQNRHLVWAQCFCTCWDPSGELQRLTLINKGRPNCLSVLQSGGRVPAPFSVISVCYPLPVVSNICKLPLILPSVPRCIEGRWEVILKLASVLFLSYESVFSDSHSFRR